MTDLKPFATKPVKPYLTDAPVLLLVFRQTHSWRPDGKKRMHYYSEVSTAIAAGILLAAIQVHKKNRYRPSKERISNCRTPLNSFKTAAV